MHMEPTLFVRGSSYSPLETIAALITKFYQSNVHTHISEYVKVDFYHIFLTCGV